MTSYEFLGLRKRRANIELKNKELLGELTKPGDVDWLYGQELNNNEVMAQKIVMYIINVLFLDFT